MTERGRRRAAGIYGTIVTAAVLAAPPMRILSWNVNGLRSVLDKGFRPWLARSRAAIVGLQEVRAHEHQLGEHTRAWKAWHRHIVASGKSTSRAPASAARRVESSTSTRLAEGSVLD